MLYITQQCVIQISKTGNEVKKRSEQLNGVFETSLHCVWHLGAQSEIHHSMFTSPHGQWLAHSQVSTEMPWTPIPTHTHSNAIKCTDLRVRTHPDLQPLSANVYVHTVARVPTSNHIFSQCEELNIWALVNCKRHFSHMYSNSINQ